MNRRRVPAATEWADEAGYSRAVRHGDTVTVAGTTATDDDGTPLAAGDAYEQTRIAIELIEDALQTVDAALTDVVRTRLYVVEATDTEAVSVAHGAAFDAIRPASTLVEVAGLIEPELLVEIEARAVVE